MSQKISAGAIVAIITTAIFLTVTTTGLLSVNQTVPSSGIVTTVNIGVYEDSSCTENLTSIEWGTLLPGDSISKTVYIKNTGNTQITVGMTKVNWNPVNADGPLTITWNRQAPILEAGEVTSATFTLSVSASITGVNDFSVDIVITGTG